MSPVARPLSLSLRLVFVLSLIGRTFQVKYKISDVSGRIKRIFGYVKTIENHVIGKYFIRADFVAPKYDFGSKKIKEDVILISIHKVPF